ncbi:MAG TPA: class I SAM-dependent methyltransferase, partial [Tepidisphaeraceae bacterium]|nr:class I SAM-dependent methyltransferase [Tepidisphaeraceae bacterium]
DACCGNGSYSRKLGRVGCEVVAFDGSKIFIEIAMQKTRPADGRIEFRHLDACDRTQLESLGKTESFDAIVCTMAMMDLPEIDTLLSVGRRLITQTGRFVFSVGHPCFHTNESIKLATQDECEGQSRQDFGCLVMRYISDWEHNSRGLLEQPVPHKMYHRSISTILTSCFRHGFVVDGMEEPAFPPDTRLRSPFSWARRPEIPPVMVIRLRPA